MRRARHPWIRNHMLRVPKNFPVLGIYTQLKGILWFILEIGKYNLYNVLKRMINVFVRVQEKDITCKKSN